MWFCILAGKFPSKLPSLPYVDEGERKGRRGLSWNWRMDRCPDREKPKAGCSETGKRLFDPVPLSVENFCLSSWPFFISINRFCLGFSFAEGSWAGRMPSLLGICLGAEAKSNRWPFLAPPPPPALINTFICILSLWLWLIPLHSPFLAESH